MSINKVILVGNLGKDPEIKYFESGESVAQFSLATSEIYKNKNGEKVTNTEWHNIVCYRKLSEISEKYLKKGMQIYLEGKIKYRSWENKEGEKRYITEIIANSIQMLGKKDSGNKPPPPEPSDRKEKERENVSNMEESINNDSQNNTNNNSNDDDLPF